MDSLAFLLIGAGVIAVFFAFLVDRTDRPIRHHAV